LEKLKEIKVRDLSPAKVNLGVQLKLARDQIHDEEDDEIELEDDQVISHSAREHNNK
jgi:hypothetical protein